MILDVCPNLSDPEVAREFNKIKDATSEKTAYNVWSLNNGYGIDKAPNGADSILFKSLLSEFDGDETKAIRAKAALFGNRFREWFGDWLQEDKTNVSKVVDENGEPLVVYHGSNSYGFTVFDPSRADDKRSIFASSSKFIASTYTNFEPLRNPLIRQRLIDNNAIDLIKNKDYKTLEKVITETLDYRLPFVPKDVFNPYLYNYDYAIAQRIKDLQQERQKPNLSQEEVDSIDAEITALTDRVLFSHNYSIKIREVKTLYQKEPKVIIKIDDNHKKDVESSYFIEKGIVFEGTPEQLIEALQTETKTYNLFLNIKNPLILDKQVGEFGASNNWDRIEFEGKSYRTREISKLAQKRGYDGVMFKDIIDHGGYKGDSDLNQVSDASITYDYFHEGEDSYTGDNIYNSDVFIAYNPNQIKSATGNIEIEKPGTGFSTTDDNIYYNLIKHPIKTVQDIKDVVTDILQRYFDFHKWRGIRITMSKKRKEDYDRQLKYVLEQFGLPSNSVTINRGGWLQFDDRAISDNFDSIKDAIGQHDKLKSIIQIGTLFEHLRSKFPNLKGIKFVKLDKANAKFENGYVLIDPNNVTADTLIEECLHPFVDALFNENPELFKNLLDEAIKQFPKLRIEIAHSYDTKQFSGEDRQKELVTQALSRHYADIYESKKETIWTKALKWIADMLGISGTVFLDPKTTLGQLADAIYNAEYVKVDENYYDSTRFNLNQDFDDAAVEAMSQMPAIKTKLDTQRETWIRSQNPQTDEERADLARKFDLQQLHDNTLNVVDAIVFEYKLKLDGDRYVATDERGKYMAMLANSILKRLSDPNFAPIEAAFLNCSVLGSDDLSTMILQMAKVYIEDFYDADAIQEVLKIIDPKSVMNMDDLETELTNLVVKAVLDPSSVECSKISKINNKIANFVRKRFGHDTISLKAKLILIDTIAKNMSCCEDLERTNTSDLLHDVKWYKITGKESQVTPKDIVNQIKKGIKIQIRSLKSVTNVDENKVIVLNQLLAKLEDVDIENNPDDVLGVVADFISQGMTEINGANADLRNMLDRKPIDIDDNRLYQIKTDVIGYYRSIINNYIIPFTRNTTNPTLQPGGALYGIIRDMLNKCTNTQHLYDYVLSQHVEALIDQFVDSNLNIGDKERFKVNCKLWLHNKVNNGDLGFFENWVKSAVSSHSPIVRIIDQFVREIDTEVRQKSIAHAKQLQSLYVKCEPSLSKLSPFNYQRTFCEIDDDGQTTGNFLTAVNVGQFEKEKRAFIDKWVSERGVEMEEDGTLLFPDDKTWKEFNDAYDDFLEGKQHRRYTAAYYKLEREYMSRDTIEYKRSIRRRIQMLYDKCFDKEIGAPNIWKLDRADLQNLQDLLKIQQNLSNPYIVEYDSNGKISKLVEKEGDLLRMALEIAEFNKALGGRISFTPNYEKYNAAKEAMKAKFGEDSMEYKYFVWNFSTRDVTPLYYAKLRQILGPRSSDIIKDLDIINHKIKAIINATLPKRGRYVQDLSKMSDEAYAELKKLEEKRYALISSISSNGTGKKLSPEEKAQLAEMHHYEYVKNPSTGNTYIKELEEEYRQKGKYKEYLDKYFVNTEDRIRPLSIFSYDYIHPEYIDEEAPTGMFSEVDIMSEFIDPEYDPEDDEFMNIDKNRYHNSKYDEMIGDPKAKKFYDEMLKMMDEAWSMLPDVNRHYKYMLPQRRGNVSQLVARDIINTFTGRKGRQKTSFSNVLKNILKLTTIGAIGGLAIGGAISLLPVTWMSAATAMISSTGYGTISGLVAGLLTRDKNIADKLFTVTENDIEFNETFSIRPDGSEVETIPIRFVKRLEDPTSVSTSLIHSVSSFYEMALNYKQKEKLAPIVENIQFELSGGFSGQSITDQAERIRTHKSAMIYGRRKTGISRRSSNKMTQSEQQITKLVQFILNTTHAKMLPWNGTSMFKNAIDSVFSFVTNVLSGKFITLSDVGHGIVDMSKEIVNGTAFTNIGSARTKSFTGAAMQYNGLHMSVSETLDDTEKYWLRRIVERFYSMGPFTFIDYTFKGLFINSLYNSYRLVLNPSTGKEEFMNKQEAQFAYANTLGRKAGLEKWKKAKVKLKNAYYVDVNSGLILKPEFESIVRPEINGKQSYKLESRISSLAREQSAVINGMLDSQDINKISQNFIGASILLMRGWMVSQLIDYNKDGQDFAVFASNIEEITKLLSNTTTGSLQSKLIGNLDSFVIQSAPTELEGQYNFATGFIERGWWVGWIKCMRNMLRHSPLTRHNKYQLKALAVILLTTISLGLATHPLYDWKEVADAEYKNSDPFNIERVASNFLYTGTVAAYSERLGQVGPFGFMNSFLELVNSPTVASSYIKDLGSLTDASEDIFTLLEAMWQGEDVYQIEPMQLVKRGSFKSSRKITRDLFKASSEMPGINTLGASNIYKTISPEAQKEKLKFYKSTIPFVKAQPWLKIPEPSGNSSSNEKLKSSNDLSWIK